MSLTSPRRSDGNKNINCICSVRHILISLVRNSLKSSQNHHYIMGTNDHHAVMKSVKPEIYKNEQPLISIFSESNITAIG